MNSITDRNEEQARFIEMGYILTVRSLDEVATIATEGLRLS